MPNSPGQLIVVFIEETPLVENPILYGPFLHKILNYLQSIFKVGVDLFLSEANIVRVIGIPGHIVAHLLLKGIQQFTSVDLNQFHFLVNEISTVVPEGS